MANSKYEYVRSFEQPDLLLANTWIVVRIDGRGFSKLTAKYKFVKPNDVRALNLMNAAAEAVMKDLPDLVLAYGNSDEFSFVFHKDCVLFERRSSKLMSTIVSTFTTYYTFLWSTYFPETPLTPPLPSFDGRTVCYPSDQNLRDYMSWRQVDCHINNLYNTTFWALVQQGGMDARPAEQELAGTVSADKNEILFSRFGINYNNEPEIFRKGSVLYRDYSPPTSSDSTPTPSRVVEYTPPLHHPQPQRQPRRISQPASLPILPKSPPSSEDSADHGPTFLSTSTTPSPPPSPPAMSYPLAAPIPASFPSNYVSTSRPSHERERSNSRFPVLTPIALPPPRLKPTTKPPPRLNPVNPTEHIDTSPLYSPIATMRVPDRNSSNIPPSKGKEKVQESGSGIARSKSHSASASMSMATSGATAESKSKRVAHRSPSLSLLEGGKGPQIPLRMSSIPANSKPRKMSLPGQKSFGMLRTSSPVTNGASTGNGASHRPGRGSPGLVLRTGETVRTMEAMQELPSPPDDIIPDANASKTALPLPLSSPDSTRGIASPGYSHSPPTSKDAEKESKRRSGMYQNEMLLQSPSTCADIEGVIPGAGLSSPTRPSKSRDESVMEGLARSRHESAPPPSSRSYNFPSPPSGSGTPMNALQYTSYTPSRSDPVERTWKLGTGNSSSPYTSADAGERKEREKKRKPKSSKAKHKVEEGGWAAGTGLERKEMSRTARDKDRKKRSKARIVIEHIDIIKDEFWIRRPWILSGKAG